MTTSTLLRIAAACLGGQTFLAHAHGGHGLAGSSHWHATDTMGLLLVVIAAAGAVWIGRGKR